MTRRAPPALRPLSRSAALAGTGRTGRKAGCLLVTGTGRRRTDQSRNQETTSCRSFRGGLRDQFRVAVPFTGPRGDPAGSDDASLSRFRDSAGRVNDSIDFRLSEAPSSNRRTLRCPSYDNAFPLTATARTSSYECDRSPHARSPRGARRWLRLARRAAISAPALQRNRRDAKSTDACEPTETSPFVGRQAAGRGATASAGERLAFTSKGGRCVAWNDAKRTKSPFFTLRYDVQLTGPYPCWPNVRGRDPMGRDVNERSSAMATRTALGVAGRVSRAGGDPCDAFCSVRRRPCLGWRGTVRNFVCGLGIMGTKEISHGPTQRACDT